MKSGLILSRTLGVKIGDGEGEHCLGNQQLVCYVDGMGFNQVEQDEIGVITLFMIY